MGAPLKGPDASPAQGTAEAILSALPNPVLMVESDGRVCFANVAGGGLFPRERDAPVPPQA